MLTEKKYPEDWIAILDLGSSYTQLIARKIRKLKVYSEILPYNVKFARLKRNTPKGIILTGDLNNRTQEQTNLLDQQIYLLNIPILGIGQGMKLLAQNKGGKVAYSKKNEFSNTGINILSEGKIDLFFGLPDRINTWMCSDYIIKQIPADLKITALDEKNNIAAFYNEEWKLYGIQFHPEVSQTDFGNDILFNFVIKICRCSPRWTNSVFVNEAIQNIKMEVGEGKVVAGISGGIDSLVAALLTHRAIGDQLHGIFINTGLMRKKEEEEIRELFHKNFKINLHIYDYAESFLNSLKGIVDPEQKRKIIGNLFIKIFEEKAREIGKVTHLLQGTLYPDVIESIQIPGATAQVKSHHNVGGLPEKMGLRLLEPLKHLFKDEVRKIAHILGIPEKIIWRQPFPGPGLAIRIAGEVNYEKLLILKEADDIIRIMIHRAGMQKELWQYFGILLPVKSVGIKDNLRTYDYTLVLRIVTSADGMTADWAKIPYDLLDLISHTIINKVHGINRVLYDISSKPPATIEWE